MADILAVGIDLGGDTLKISFAYERAGAPGSVIYGKFEKKESVRHVAIPAVAYYDATRGWIFGADVEKGEEKPFINVVKIKTLLSLLYPEMRDGKIYKVRGKEFYPNKTYFYEKEYFPKFFFPNRMRDLSAFPALIEEDRAFIAKGSTPQKVCRAFFEYARAIVNDGIAKLRNSTGRDFDELRLSLVYPSQVGKLYAEELTNLVKTAFGKQPCKVMNSGRALSMFALERGAVRADDEILIFDMGEDTLSVLKCFINDDGKIVVEPAADHSLPAQIGGNDVDFCIADAIERSIERRETVGCPSYGEEGHVQEEGLQSKQYLFLKEIKKAKLLLSIPSLEKVFKKGVPVSLHRDLYLQLSLSREQLKKCVGITDGTGIASDILNYIAEELALPVNSDVKSVFLTGGLVETYGLKFFIKNALREKFPKVVVRTFDDNVDNGKETEIQTYEDSVYAPAVGAAIVALKNYDVSAGLTNSYGTWFSVNGVKILGLLVNRGYMFDENVSQKIGSECNLQGTVNEEFFSVRLSQSSINKRKYEGEVAYLTAQGVTYLCIGEKGSAQRKRVEKLFQLKNISGNRAKIVCSYRGRTVVNCEPRPRISEGIISSPDSAVMTPYVEKLPAQNARTRITYESGGSAWANISDLDIKLVGVSSIVGETD